MFGDFYYKLMGKNIDGLPESSPDYFQDIGRDYKHAGNYTAGYITLFEHFSTQYYPTDAHQNWSWLNYQERREFIAKVLNDREFPGNFFGTTMISDDKGIQFLTEHKIWTISSPQNTFKAVANATEQQYTEAKNQRKVWLGNSIGYNY